MKLHHRRLLQWTLGGAAASAFSRGASALDYPPRAVRIIVGFAGGSGLDIYARLIGQWLSDHLANPSSWSTGPAPAVILRPEAALYTNLR